MKKYFKITGFDNGKPIKPYGVETYASYPTSLSNISLCQDRVRYYEPITKEEYNKLMERRK